MRIGLVVALVALVALTTLASASDVVPLEASSGSPKSLHHSAPKVDAEKLRAQNRQYQHLLDQFQRSEEMKETALREQAERRELGETEEVVKSCKAQCTGQKGCNGVFIQCGKQGSDGCQKLSDQKELGDGVELQAAEKNPDCMKECEAKGAMCKGIYISQGGGDCHMVLEQHPGNSHLYSGKGTEVGINSSPGAEKTVNVNVHVNNYHNNPNPASKDSSWKPLAGDAKAEVEAARKEAAKTAAKEEMKKEVEGDEKAKAADEKATETAKKIEEGADAAKATETETKAKDTAEKAKDTEAKAKDAEAKDAPAKA